ncbi:glucosamine phosphate N-acetyltransferase [Encephalitozoon intestinalis ATCC 50506]|uniref:Glucosamine 6-phosphate N-acetyltransferase n=1 Tax=Encephalitozoon intestinalis (strain ATCC 50506) TaxID=876142 RepID=E0S897_ENCIT|nr:glucosamine phosphate N-acetyltransferase [Encephalitozoon intestinalis ATCC 50506]ADM11932.1 glucosamine phosphate N-acetyltransferase [Encephalitozoon intestinalis ATCC 50506]UTX45690.1 glucosamine phosphate N-acetyltransferase [Encephalitozoon intestinalis]
MRKRDQVLCTIGCIGTLIVVLVLSDSLFGKGDLGNSNSNVISSGSPSLSMCDIPILKRENYILKGLDINDYERGFVECLNELTIPGKVTKEQFKERYLSLCKDGCYKIVVAYNPHKDKIIGSGTLFVEKKFIRGCVSKGHIEDVVVSSEYRGEGIGKDIVEKLIEISKNMGCYKTALVCDLKNLEFYRRCGMKEKEREMVIYH